MARSKQTDQRVETICLAISRGATIKDACEAVGIHKDTYFEWMKGAAFSDRVSRAEAECAVRMASKLADGAETDWRAAESWLKRRRSDEWGDKQTHELDSRISDLMAALVKGREAPAA